MKVWQFAIVAICNVLAQPHFYIYEWSQDFHDVYPPPNAILNEESYYDHSFYPNSGAGLLLNEEVGLFQTWQFSMYKVVMQRLLVSKFRTREAFLADVFIVPFDAGVHSYIDHKNGKRRLGSPHAWSLIRHLQESPHWKNQGHDHFIFFSLTEFVMTGIAVKEFWMGICQNCTALTIEASPTRTSTPYHRTRKYWYAVPYPSSFHWWEGIKVLPWKQDNNFQRDILSLFIGSVKTSNTNSNVLRRILQRQCEGETGCHWHPTAHACNGVVNSTSQMLLFRRARYCLCPPGDSVTRKSIFDALLGGCVPIIFARASLSQYYWFLSKQDAEDIALYIPIKNITEQGQNFMHIIKSIPLRVLRAKQSAIERVAPNLQYSVVPKAFAVTGPKAPPPRAMDGRSTWDPLVPDAVDVIIRRLLDPVTIFPSAGLTDDELAWLNCLQNALTLRHPDYAGLFHGTVSRFPIPSPAHCLSILLTALMC